MRQQTASGRLFVSGQKVLKAGQPLLRLASRRYGETRLRRPEIVGRGRPPPATAPR